MYFELASQSRLSILRELQSEKLKMQEIARRLDVTATEAFRQLERLSTALLVRKLPDGTFELAEYGKLVLQISSSLEFVSKYRDYFSKHDTMRLPIPFVNRLGELSKTTLITDTMESLNRGQRMFLSAERFGWGLAEGVVPELIGPLMTERVSKGMKCKFIVHESYLPPSSETTPNVEVRGLLDVPAVVALTEKEAVVCFRLIDGKIDYAGFYGEDETFRNWVKDLFLYFWEKAKRQ